MENHNHFNMHAIPYLMLLKFDYKVVTLISNIFQRKITNGGKIPGLSSFQNVFDPYVAETQYICNKKKKKKMILFQNYWLQNNRCIFKPISYKYTLK